MGLTQDQRRAEIIKNKNRENSAEFLDKFMEFGVKRASRNVVTMLEIVRKSFDEYLRDKEQMCFILSEQVANTETQGTRSRVAYKTEQKRTERRQ